MVQLLASIITDRFDNTLKVQSDYYIRKESKNCVKKLQHKLNQTNHRPVFKETIKVEEKLKKIHRIETIHS